MTPSLGRLDYICGSLNTEFLKEQNWNKQINNGVSSMWAWWYLVKPGFVGISQTVIQKCLIMWGWSSGASGGAFALHTLI